MTIDQTTEQSFADFARSAEPRLRRALCAEFGIERGREATSEALVCAWQNWSHVRRADNPIGYLYTVGRNSVRSARRTRTIVLPSPPPAPAPWIEPGLPKALGRLSPRERTVVMLVHGYEWTMSEAAEVLDVAKSTVQTHLERAMKKLRRQLGVAE